LKTEKAVKFADNHVLFICSNGLTRKQA